MSTARTPVSAALLVAGVLAAAPVARADDTLILPPELRAGATSPPSSVPAKPKKPAKALKSHAAAVAAPPPATPSPPVAATPKARAQDDALSFGMKWNADNQPNHGAATTDGLIDGYNKTLNNQPVGSGGEVGFKYKF